MNNCNVYLAFYSIKLQRICGQTLHKQFNSILESDSLKTMEWAEMLVADQLEQIEQYVQNKKIWSNRIYGKVKKLNKFYNGTTVFVFFYINQP